MITSEKTTRCTVCGKESASLTEIGGDLVCEVCLADSFFLCDVCRTYRGSYEYYEQLPNGRKMCAHCVRSLEADFAAAFSDELTELEEECFEEPDPDELPEEEVEEDEPEEDEACEDPDYDPDDDTEFVPEGDIYDD